MKRPKKQTDITIFYSYAEADRALRDYLATHLSQLRRDGMVKEWYDQEILAGADYTQEIDEAIRSAQVVLLLISADFLASDTCYHVETQHALERHRRGEARVVPVLVRACDWERSPFAHLQCLPRNRKPVTSWNNQDEAFTSIAQDLRKVITQQQFVPPPLSRVQRQNRVTLLKRVRQTWIEGGGLLERSLHHDVWIDPCLQDQPDALENPWHLEVRELNREPRPLPLGTSILQVYDEADGELLILGEPGAGKTTLLLHLAQTLLDRAKADDLLPMPVVFNLPSWARRHQPLAQWLVEELASNKYRIPQKVAQHWVETNQILPLLDGLDEVFEEARIACIQAITAYCSQHPTQMRAPLVVCCRTEEYQALSKRLLLNRAVSILPLIDEQIETYLSSAQGQLDELQQALDDHAELKELVRRPLMLNIFSLVYQGMPARELHKGSTQEQTLRDVFERYVKRMLEQRRGALQRWTPEQFRTWLSYLAKQMYRQQQTIFSVEDLQPDWLPAKKRSIYLNVKLTNPFSAVRKQPIEVIAWSWKRFLGCLLSCQLLGALLGLSVFARLFRLVSGVSVGLAMGLVCGLLFGVLFGLSGKQLTERDCLSPNEGIRRSGKNGLLAGLLTELACGLLFGLFFGLLFELSVEQSIGRFDFTQFLLWGYIGLIFGLPLACFAGLRFGLSAFMKHFFLRFRLWRKKRLPWNLIPFLDEAVERLLLRKVGGSYIFVHKLLLEYFASLDSAIPSDPHFEAWERAFRGILRSPKS